MTGEGALMTSQLVLVAVAILIAGSYVAWQTYRTWFPSGEGCSGGCGCSTPMKSPAGENLTSATQLTARVRQLRKG